MDNNNNTKQPSMYDKFDSLEITAAHLAYRSIYLICSSHISALSHCPRPRSRFNRRYREIHRYIIVPVRDFFSSPVILLPDSKRALLRQRCIFLILPGIEVLLLPSGFQLYIIGFKTPYLNNTPSTQL